VGGVGVAAVTRLLVVLIVLGWLAVGMRVGRVAARRCYRYWQEKYPMIAEQSRQSDFRTAVGLGVGVMVFWPAWVLWHVARRLLVYGLGRSAPLIPEYHAAELEAEIERQRAEIERLHQQIGVRDQRSPTGTR
jgi:hypothetical protein